MIVLKAILSDRRKAVVFARHVLAETAWVLLPVGFVVLFGLETLLASLAIGAGGFVVGLLLAVPLRLLVIERALRRRGRTLEQIAAMNPKEFSAEIGKGWDYFAGRGPST